MTPERAYEQLEGGFACMDELGQPEWDMAELRRLAALYLPPEHREAIGEVLGCSDRPAEFWHRYDGHLEPTIGRDDEGREFLMWIACCPCGMHLRMDSVVAKGVKYRARICESPDGLSGCGTVWWTRREATQGEVAAGEDIEPGQPVYIGPDGRAYGVSPLGAGLRALLDQPPTGWPFRASPGG